MRVAENVLELIGQTPLVRLRDENPVCAKIYAKFELANPGGSVKDRIALNMLMEAESRGLLGGGKSCVVEPTSGNTGVGLAMVSAVKGYRCVLVMPEGLPKKRYALPKAYGAELVLTPFELGMKGAVDKAKQLVEENPSWFCPMQFNNRANPAMHRKTTAQEILKAFKQGVDAFVAAVGTGGTLTGVAQALKKKYPRLRVVAVEPQNSAVLSGGQAGPHRIQGIGAGFVPAVLNMGLVDEIVKVSDEDALSTARGLARNEGLLVGVSSGANIWAARQVARKIGGGKIVVSILCDRGEPYLSDEGDWE